MPGGTVLAEAERLLAAPPGPPGAIGIEVQDLTPPVASVTAASVGVVVVWVDPDGASREQLMVGDVIEAVDSRGPATRPQWDVRVGSSLGGRDTHPSRAPPRRNPRGRVGGERPCGASPPVDRLVSPLRARANIGAEVVRVERGSAADRAGLTIGDVITLAAEVSAPTPAQVTRSYTSLGQGERMIVAVTRGDAHFVTTFER